LQHPASPQLMEEPLCSKIAKVYFLLYLSLYFGSSIWFFPKGSATEVVGSVNFDQSKVYQVTEDSHKEMHAEIPLEAIRRVFDRPEVKSFEVSFKSFLFCFSFCIFLMRHSLGPATRVTIGGNDSRPTQRPSLRSARWFRTTDCGTCSSGPGVPRECASSRGLPFAMENRQEIDE